MMTTAVMRSDHREGGIAETMSRRWVHGGVILAGWVSVGFAIQGLFLPWAMIDVRQPAAITSLQGATRSLRDASPLGETVKGLTHDLHHIVVKVRRGAETVTGTLGVGSLPELPSQVTGADIPRMANQEQAKVAMALVELFTHRSQDVGRKSYAVYAVPGLAVVCGLLLSVFGRRWVIALTIAWFCGTVAAIGFWTLLTVNPQTLFVAIRIGRGLWQSVWAYVGLTVCALLELFLSLAGRSRSVGSARL